MPNYPKVFQENYGDEFCEEESSYIEVENS